MACAVRYLNSAGIHHREVKGVDALAAAYPDDWLMFASLTAFPVNQAPIEIDLLVVMDDRIVLLELKDWNGPLTQTGDLWVHGGRRFRSPAVLGNEKAKKLKSLLKGQIPSLRTFVDSRVVLTGTSTRDLLLDSEKPQVLTLAEAALLADKVERNRLLGRAHLTTVKPNTLMEEFDRLLGNPSYFQPLKMTWDGYGVVDENFYVHRGGVWSEHRAELQREDRVKALLRLWSFDRLAPGLNEPSMRRLIAERDLRATAFLDERSSWLAERGVLKQVGSLPDEVLTNHHQLFSTPSNSTTLRRYFAKFGAELEGEQKIDIAHSLARMVAELHSHGVSHRDIGDASIWITEPTRMQLTGFSSASIPDDTSIPDYLAVLGTYADVEPDWDGVKPTGKERDVRSIGLIMRDLAMIGEGSASLPSGWNQIVDRALAAPGERYSDGAALAEALGDLRTPAGPQVDQSRLDAFETTLIPYVEYPPQSPTRQNGSSTSYQSHSGDRQVSVKIWNGVIRGDALRDLALLSMMEVAASLQAVPLEGVTDVVSFGLSPVGPFVATGWAEGVPLSAFEPSDADCMLDAARNLVFAIEALHVRGFSHGDLHPDNVLVDPDGIVTIIDLFDISLVGDGRVATPGWAPDNRERCTDQQIDRFAICKMVGALVERFGGEDGAAAGVVVANELQRKSIETLRPLAEAIEKTIAQRAVAPAPHYKVVVPGATPTLIGGQEGKPWVKVHRSGDRDVVWITGLTERLLIRLVDGTVELASVSATPFAELGSGLAIEMSISIETGDSFDGIAALANAMIGSVPEIMEQTTPIESQLPDWEGEEEISEPEVSADDRPPAALPVSLDVAKFWLRTAEIEEETVLQVTIDRRLADAGDSALFTYASSGPLEFEDEDTVEVRRGGLQGWRVGYLDVAKCDQKHLAIRDLRQSLSEGEVIALVDKRDRISKERRRRAVERIADRDGVIADLIDYFDPHFDGMETDFDLRIDDDALAKYGLNTGQQSAFRDLLRYGPVGLLQGPPGSGKTRFIASFAHWLLTAGGARRVLIASQSHEAVNNVLEEVLKTYRTRGGAADVLRVGSRGATDRIRPYQARSLRDRYRVRFENGLKTRVASAAAVAGISRAFIQDVADIDQRLGSLKRSIDLKAIALEHAATVDERRRLETKIVRLKQAFARAASELLQREVDPDNLDLPELIRDADQAVLARHRKASPSDLSTAKRLLELANEWTDTLGTGHRNFDEFLAKTRRVVAGTCVGLGQSLIGLEHSTFDWVIVDEAARCTSGELAVPLQLGIRVVLVGDQQQLRPMVDRAVQKGLREEFGALGKEIARSDFERAFTSPFGKKNARVLDEQYRMAPAISELVSTIFYAPHGVRLKPSPARVPDAAFIGLPADLSQPVVWFDTSAMPDARERDRNQHRDYWNDAEIRTIISILTRLSREQTLIEDLAKRGDPAIGVICMYSEQKRRLEREWSQHPFPEFFRRIVTIDTVDAYQGKENAVVIVSLVRANKDALVGHVGRENRCNVAMSRAKERLYIVGNADMWSGTHIRSPMKTVLARVRRMDNAEGGVRPAGGLST